MVETENGIPKNVRNYKELKMTYIVVLSSTCSYTTIIFDAYIIAIPLAFS